VSFSHAGASHPNVHTTKQKPKKTKDTSKKKKNLQHLKTTKKNKKKKKKKKKKKSNTRLKKKKKTKTPEGGGYYQRASGHNLSEVETRGVEEKVFQDLPQRGVRVMGVPTAEEAGGGGGRCEKSACGGSSFGRQRVA